ncbi:neuronal acetylcholine receptor subunit alpha-7 [Exaiptasia diaphana]|uniref:Uncharacterized protein n=1 Tax=Exaiptasia diaphana TaxID=2652724 RepID=A0A913YSX0_EXADI|nr:neuronal acetylcholine receptor subunit alpha-7 [Exaiptasia diaphana]
MKSKVLPVVFAICFSLVQGTSALIGGATKISTLQHKLIQDLLDNYDKDSHPGGNSTVMVTLGAKLARLVKVEEVNNVIKAQWWMKQVWYNPDLKWNKSHYGNIDTVFVEPRRIWVPDVLLYNNGDEKVDAAGGVEKFKTKIKIESNGMQSWLAPTIFTSMCKMDIRYFPFDEQFCELQFGSWSYDSRKIDLQVDQNETKIHKEVYQENNEWKVTSVTAKKRSKRYPCCKYPYTDILVILHMHRRSYHYVVNLVFPCAVIAAMVFCTFLLPAESGERISLCITVLMAMTIFQELTSEKLPASSEGFILIGEI